MKKLISIIGLIFTFCLTVNASAPPDSDIPEWMMQYREDSRLLNRFYNISGTPEYTQQMLQLTDSYLKKLEDLNYNKLSLDAKIDYQLFHRQLEEDTEGIRQEAEELADAKKILPFAGMIYELVKIQRRGEQPDAQQTAARLNELNKMISESISMVIKGDTLDARIARPAVRHVEDMQKALKLFYDFYFDYDPLFTWWTKQPYEENGELLKKYIDLLRSKNRVESNQRRDRSGIVGNPIGDAEIRRRLQYEMIPYSPEELIRIAEKEFAWCDREMLKASRELGYGDKWRDALEYVKETYVEPGKQPELILRLYNESVAFVKEHDLVTVPELCEENWQMRMMSAERQRVNPFFLGGEQIIISYPTSEMTHEEKLMSMRGNNGHFSRATVHHELIPGHWLQMYMNARYKPYRRYWNGFWGEGWSLYWERLLWDLDFPQSAEDRIGMLFWRMHRCARIIFSLKYHMGEWTPQECIDFLVERVGHEYANAEGEVRRSFTGGYDPLYQLAYMIGGLQFESLRKTLVESGKMSYREFHDRILHENQMPVELVRAILLEDAPEKDFKTKWRFYDLE
ncbi:MAG: DUF885 family protein [Saprospiraceae bacterium]